VSTPARPARSAHRPIRQGHGLLRGYQAVPGARPWGWVAVLAGQSGGDGVERSEAVVGGAVEVAADAAPVRGTRLLAGGLNL